MDKRESHGRTMGTRKMKIPSLPSFSGINTDRYVSIVSGFFLRKIPTAGTSGDLNFPYTSF